MGWYRRLIFYAFRRCNRNTRPFKSFSGTIFRKPVLQDVVNNIQKKSPNFVDRSCGVVIPVYYWNLETVPYTKRRHFVLLSPYLEKVVGDLLFKVSKSQEFRGKILDSHHPESIRVEKIGRDIIGGLVKGLNKLEDGERTAHLEEFKWEFFVVDDPTTVNAVCFPGGKIVVFTGLFKYLKTDAEIATVIGHEVGHAVARHSAEMMSGILWLLILSFSMSDLLAKMSDLFLLFPFSRRNEMEADYIGVLISACAGYDPRIAPEVYVKLEGRSLSLLDAYRSTHPHGNKRAQQLSHPKVMEEALSIYREALKDKQKDSVGLLNFFNDFINRVVF